MKKQLSKRIGAILTMTAMLVTLIPMAIPVMATGEETETATNYITNGDFANGEIAPWTISAGTSSTVKISTTTKYDVTKPSLYLQRNTSVYHVVELDGGYSYELSMLVDSSVAEKGGAETTIEFGCVDESGAFTNLDSAENASSMMKGGLFETGSDSAVSSKIIVRSYAHTEISTETSRTERIPFNLPKEANAVKITLAGTNAMLGSGGFVLIDNIELKKVERPIEMVYNGSDMIYNAATTAPVGWARTSNTNLKEYSTWESDGISNRYLKFTRGNKAEIYFAQDLTLRKDKLYKLKFNFAQNAYDEAAPVVSLEIPGLNGIVDTEISPAFRKAANYGSTLNFSDEYETYITVDVADDYAFDLVSAKLVIRSCGEDDGSAWASGAAYYDNISLVEVDADTQMAFAAGENGEFTTTPADAKAASCIFVQGETPTIQKFIVAKYNSTTHALESATTVSAGEDIAVGNAKRYDVEIADDATSYYRIFLWDGTTLKPVLNSKEIGR